MSRERVIEDLESNTDDMEGDELNEDEFDREFCEVGKDYNDDLHVSCKETIQKKMRKSDTEKYLNHECMLSFNGDGRLDSSVNVDVKSQDADYSNLPQLSDELETMIMARIPILELGKLSFVNKKFLNLTKNGGLLRERKIIGFKEASVFMLASGEANWRAFDQAFKSHWTLPILPCEDAVFQFGDKESLCIGTNLLICGYEMHGPVIWTYDVLSKNWYKGPSMVNPRCLFASASCRDFAYVAGGLNLDTREIRNSAEKYDPKTKSWQPIPNMIERRKMCSGVYMDDKFYVLGGQDHNGDVFTCSEVFHEEKNAWVKISGMLNGLTLATSQSPSPPLVAVANNELYLFETSSNCLMVYLKKQNSWKDLGPVPVRADINKGWGVAFKSLGDQLLVIGGSTISQSGCGMTIYTCIPNPNAEKLSWKFLAGGVGNCRSHFIRNCTVMLA